MSTLLEIIQKKQKELQAKQGRDKTVKAPNGSSRWRVLPHSTGSLDLLPSQDFGSHFIKDFSGDVKAVYICTAKTFGRECPMCEAIQEAAMKPGLDPNAKKLIEEGKSAQRYLVNAVLKDDKKGYASDVSLLELSGAAFNQLMQVAAQYMGDDINIFDLEKGVDVIINREGTGINTKYQVMPAPKGGPISAEYLKKSRDLQKYVDQEFAEGQTRALVAVRSMAGSSTPSLTGPARTGALSSEETRVTGTAAIAAGSEVLGAATAADISSSLGDLDLGDLDLDSLELVGESA